MAERYTVDMLVTLACADGGAGPIPAHMRLPLARYIMDGQPVGGFLHAVLCDQAARATANADPANLRALPAYYVFLHRYGPSSSWGRPETVAHWMAIGGLNRTARPETEGATHG